MTWVLSADYYGYDALNRVTAAAEESYASGGGYTPNVFNQQFSYDRFGNRLSGSESLERAIDWILAEMARDSLAGVRGELVMVPHWVRGRESLDPPMEFAPGRGLTPETERHAVGTTVRVALQVVDPVRASARVRLARCGRPELLLGLRHAPRPPVSSVVVGV